MSMVTAIVDAHVHLHACHDPDALFSSAARNLSRARLETARGGERALFLLLAECQDDNCFDKLRSGGLRLAEWSLRPTSEANSLLLTDGYQSLYVVAGRQVACREGLEVLVLGTTARFADGRPIRELLEETRSLNLPRVIPWGPGKWLFRRGRLLNELVEAFHDSRLFLGDEGGRPGFWGYPSHFVAAARLGVRDLPGTDPLPFPHDVDKVGRMGFGVPLDLDPARPAASLLRVLIDPAVAFERFATLEPPMRFVRNQLGMQMRKRRAAIA